MATAMRKCRLYRRSIPAAAGAGLLMLVARLAGQQAQPAQAPEHAGEYSQADIQSGSVVYAGQCSQCHGPTGDQVSGVDLRSGRFRNATSDDDLRRIVSNGLPGTSMPGRRLEPPQLTAIVAFIRNMRDFNSAPVAAGDAARGLLVFDGTGCANCHAVAGKGSRIAPDLSEIGSARNAAALQQSLLDPSSTMMPIDRPVRIVTKSGQTINGRRLNEDTYTIQLITDQERLMSVSKSDLSDYQVLTTSSMPSYKDKLSPQDIADVVSYLGSLRAAGAGRGGEGRQGGAPQGGPPAQGGRQGGPGQGGQQGPPPGQR
jgi:putative heme-binding domain-containing protein